MQRLSLTLFLVAAAMSGGLFAVAVTASDAAGVRSLDNGFKIVLREDASNPLVSCMVVVHTGSRFETEATLGLSHFLEHMVFDGTETRTKRELKEEFDLRGIYANAFTRADYTAYFIEASPEQIADGMELQSDMLLHSAIPEDEFSREAQVVVEEIKKDSDQPETRADDLFCAHLFSGTPYARPVIGYPETIESVTRQQVVDYCKERYVPGNMTAIITGSFNSDKMLEALEDLYGGPCPSAPADAARVAWDLREDKRFDETIKGVTSYVRIGMAAPLATDPDAPAFEVMASILASKDSPLTRLLTQGDDPPARSVWVGYDWYKDIAALTITAIPADAAQVDRCVSGVREALAEFCASEVSGGELARTKLAAKAQRVFAAESFHMEMTAVAQWEGTAGYEFSESYYSALEKVGPGEVSEVGTKWLAGPKAVVVLRASEEDLGTGPPRMPGMGGGGYRPAFYYSDVWGGSGAALADLDQPVTQKRVLANGLTVIARQVSGSPVCAIHVLSRHRIQLEPEGKNGVSNLVQLCLEHGTKTRTKDQIAKELADIAAELKVADNPMFPFDDYYNSKDYAYIRLQVLSEFAPQARELLCDLIANPSFPEDEFEKGKESAVRSIAMAKMSAGAAAGRLAAQTLFPQATPWAGSIEGGEATVSTLAREDLVEYHSMGYAPNNLIISVVSAELPSTVFEQFEEALGTLPRVALQLRQQPIPSVRTEPEEKTVQVDVDQARVIVGCLLPGADTPDAPAIMVMNEVLSARLADNLRERQGLAYSVGSGAEFHPGFGEFWVGMGTRNENVEVAKRGIADEIRRMQTEPPSERELETQKNALIGHILRYHQSKLNQAYYLGLFEHLGLGFEYDGRLASLISEVTAEQVAEAARRYIDPASLVTVVAGRAREG